MFDLGWQELFLVALIALVVVGPKQMPAALRTVSQVVRKGRTLAHEFRRSVDEVIREAELDDIRQQVRRAGQADLGQEAERIVDPEGHLRRQFGPEDVLDEATRRAVDEMNPTDSADEPDPDPRPAPPPEQAEAAPGRESGG